MTTFVMITLIIVMIILSIAGIVLLFSGAHSQNASSVIKETFTDSQKESKKMCSQSNINDAYNLYVFGDTTKTKI